MAERWQQWMPHDIDAWQGSANVQALSDLAYRAVHNLILDMWKQPDCALPIDEKELAKRSRVATRWAECREEVLDYFDRNEEGKLMHRVTFKKWNEAREVYEKRQAAAKKTNDSRSPLPKRDGDRSGDREPSATLTPRPADTGTSTGTSTSTEKEQKPSRGKREGFDLPEWVDAKAFERYAAMRKKNRKPVTDDAVPLLVKKLAALKCVGHDPTAVLDQSTMNGWQGLFEVKADGKTQPIRADASLGTYRPEETEAGTAAIEEATRRSYWAELRNRGSKQYEKCPADIRDELGEPLTPEQIKEAVAKERGEQ